MNEQLTKLIETAIAVNKGLSEHSIGLYIYKDMAEATITTNKVSDLGRLHELTKDTTTRIVANGDVVEIKLYVDY